MRGRSSDGHRPWWLPLIPVALVIALGIAVALHLRRDADARLPARTSPPATEQPPEGPSASARAGGCDDALAAWTDLAAVDPSDRPAVARATARVRALLPPELGPVVDRWWAQLHGDGAGAVVAPAPELDAWLDRACS